MSRYRLTPTPAQEAALLEHCAHARYVWNLAVEQDSYWRPGRKSAPSYQEQCRQLTEARAEFEWLGAGVASIQQQALKDYAHAKANYFKKVSKSPPGYRKQRVHEGFRVVGARGRAWDVRRLSRNVGEVRIPKAGWVRFRWSRAVPAEAKSYRITRDRAGRWHVAFAVAPGVIPAPGTGEVAGVDLGVTVGATLSTGEMFDPSSLRRTERDRLLRLRRKLSKAQKDSKRRIRVKLAAAKLIARDVARRKDWIEKTSTDLARRFDVIGVEDLKIADLVRSAKGTIEAPGRGVRQKAGLNRAILSKGWGTLIRRLTQKAPDRVVLVRPAFTSQTCNACKHIARESRESQALFRCVACGHQDNADVNAAKNIRDIAAGHAVNARRGDPVTGPVKREPQLVPV